MSFGELELQAYEERLKWLRLEANTLKKYEAKAREEGERIGIAKGRKEEKKEIARKMLEKGMDAKMIKELTGYSLEDIDWGNLSTWCYQHKLFLDFL